MGQSRDKGDFVFNNGQVIIESGLFTNCPKTTYTDMKCHLRNLEPHFTMLVPAGLRVLASSYGGLARLKLKIFSRASKLKLHT